MNLHTHHIGMGDWHWNPEGEIETIAINNGCTNVHVSAIQLARWGHLFLNHGNWNGKQLISKDWVKIATTVVTSDIPVAETDRKNTVGSGCYGFNWWVNGIKSDGHCKMPGAPANMYFLQVLITTTVLLSRNGIWLWSEWERTANHLMLTPCGERSLKKLSEAIVQ